MHVFNITATEKSKMWVDDHRIDLTALSAALSLLVSEIHPTMKIVNTKLTLQILFGSDSSSYSFKTNKIQLCEEPYHLKSSSWSVKHKAIFDHFLHEFRHWMQSRIYKIGVREISYTDEDVLNNTNAYYRNKLEVDARQFVRQYHTKLCKYYKFFLRGSVNN